MGNKGMTLIELLAVIVILGIVMTIAGIAYGGYIEASEKKAFHDNETTLKSASESFMTYCLDHTTAPSCVLPPDQGKTISISLDTLVKRGFMDAVYNSSNQNLCTGKVDITNTSSTVNYKFTYKVCLNCGKYKSESCS